MREGPEIWNKVPQAVESGWTMQLPPPDVRPMIVTLSEAFSAAGTKLPQEKLTGEIST